jgi:hypothetical protein
MTRDERDALTKPFTFEGEAFDARVRAQFLTCLDIELAMYAEDSHDR